MNGNLAQFVQSDSAAVCPHPNEVDRKRIERVLGKRKRYRYVTPEVRSIAGGYEIVSPCCSRNIDPEGGIIDIARLEFQAHSERWMLYCKDHEINHWIRYGEFLSLHQMLEYLNEDPDRRFWQ